jgi:hypothetical protein
MDRRCPSKVIENNTILVDNDDSGDGFIVDNGFISTSDAITDDDDDVDDADDNDDASHIIVSTRTEQFHVVRPSIGLPLPQPLLAVMASIDDVVQPTSLSSCVLSIGIMLLMIMVS